MDMALEAVERLVREQSSRLEEVCSGHEALVEALRSLRGCRAASGDEGAAGARVPAPPAPSAFGRHASTGGCAEDVTPTCRSCGGTGKDLFGRPCACDEGRRLEALGPETVHTPERRPHAPVTPAGVIGGFGGLQQGGLPQQHEDARDTSGRRASSTPAEAGCRRRPAGGLGTLDSNAMRVVAAAHARGLLLSDLETLPEKDWVELGATPAMRHVILQAIREWRQRLNAPGGAAGAAEKGVDPARRAGFGPAGPRTRPFGGGADYPWYVPPVADEPYQRRVGLASEADSERLTLEDGANAPRPGPHPSVMRDHIVGGTAVGDGPSAHGHYRANDFDRVLGHAKQHYPPKDHIAAGVATGDEAGAGGHPKDICFEDGLQRGIGHGRYHAYPIDHIHGGTAEDDSVGPHGHKKDTCFQDGLERGIGHGRYHLYAKDHIYAGMAEDDSAGKHGHNKDTVFQGGLQRGIGHGRRHIDVLDHVRGGCTVDDAPGTHGQVKDDHYQGGLQRGIGHGRHHFQVVDHIQGGTAEEDPVGAHGHARDDDFQGGLQRGIGHGRRHLHSGLEGVLKNLDGASVSTPEKADKESSRSPGSTSTCDTSDRPERPAGLPSRYATLNGSNTCKRLCW